jgi:hypothetical protein
MFAAELVHQAVFRTMAGERAAAGTLRVVSLDIRQLGWRSGRAASRTCELVSVAKMKHETENELKIKSNANCKLLP